LLRDECTHEPEEWILVDAVVAIDDFRAGLHDPERIVGVKRQVREHRAACKMPLPALLAVSIACIVRYAFRPELRCRRGRSGSSRGDRGERRAVYNRLFGLGKQALFELAFAPTRA